jgi:FixJ family two-component response regulator
MVPSMITPSRQVVATRSPIVSRRVWVVDDDPSLRRALQRLLRACGFAVESFGSAEEVLEVAPARWPDCLVLDIHLGALSGFDVHTRLQAAGARIPTIFITGHDDAATREQARRMGAASYLRKPFDDHTLVAAIERALAR